MSEKNELGRRRFVKVSAATGFATGSGIIGSATAESTPESAEESGVKEEIDDHISAGDLEKAAEVAEKNGAKHTIGTGSVPALGKERDLQAEPDDALNQSNSSMNFYTGLNRYEDADGIYDASVSLTLQEDDANFVDNATPKDAVGIYWSDTYWQPVSQTSSNLDINGSDSDLVEYEDYHIYGVEAKVDDNEFQNNNVPGDGAAYIDFAISTEIEKLDTSNEYNITAEYFHNWKPGGGGNLDSLNLGPAGFKLKALNVDSWTPPLEETNKE